MTDTKPPFEEKDVLVRLPKDEYSFERVFAKSGDSPFRVSMYWLVRDRWCPCQPTMHDVAELLRQVRESQDREKKLANVGLMLVETIEAHEIESLSCDRDGETYCECVRKQAQKFKAALAPQKGDGQ